MDPLEKTGIPGDGAQIRPRAALGAQHSGFQCVPWRFTQGIFGNDPDFH